MKKIYCEYCRNVFSSPANLSDDLCVNHPNGYKAGPHLFKDIPSIEKRLSQAKEDLRRSEEY